MWADELDAFFLYMAYLSFAFLFSFIITIVIEMPCHNLYDSFILGKENVIYNRGAASYGNQSSGGKREIKTASIEEDESDAETLDTVEAGEQEQSQFITNSKASYKMKANK